MSALGRLGEGFLRRVNTVLRVGAIIAGVLYLAVQPRYWPRTVRERTCKQILFTGYEAMSLVLLIAVLAGVSVVAQAQLWLSRVGQSDMLGPLLVGIIVDGLGPLLVNFIVIARSGTAIATELANMRVHHEVHVLDSLGADPSVYLLMPRVVGFTLSVFGLTMLFVVASFVSGYLFGFLTNVTAGDPTRFASEVFRAVTPRTAANLLVRTLLPGMVTSSICCLEGISVRGATTEVPQAATRAVVRSLATVLFVSAVMSVLTYV